MKRTLEERLASRVDSYMSKNDIKLTDVKDEIKNKTCGLSKMERDYVLKQKT